MEPTAADAASIYPALPTAASSEESQQQFRLSEISRQKAYLEAEAKDRTRLRKNYRSGLTATNAVDGAATVAGMGLGIAGVALLTTVVAAPLVVALEAAALAFAAAGVAAKFIAKRPSVKERKHNDIRVLALAKINTVATHVSDALRDGLVSDKEFRLIMEEVGKYEAMKAEIRAASKTAHEVAVIDEETKNELIRRGHDKARASMMSALISAASPAPAPRR